MELALSGTVKVWLAAGAIIIAAGGISTNILPIVQGNPFPRKIDLAGNECSKSANLADNLARFRYEKNTAGGLRIIAPDIPASLYIICRINTSSGSEPVRISLAQSGVDWGTEAGRSRAKNAGLWIDALIDSGQSDQALHQQASRTRNIAPKTEGHRRTVVDPQTRLVYPKGDSTSIVIVIEVKNPWEGLSPIFDLGQVELSND